MYAEIWGLNFCFFLQFACFKIAKKKIRVFSFISHQHDMDKLPHMPNFQKFSNEKTNAGSDYIAVDQTGPNQT